MLLVDDYWDAASVIVHRHAVPLRVDLYAQFCHRRVSLLVVRRVHEHLVEDLVQAWVGRVGWGGV